jgi:hypothetical protein
MTTIALNTWSLPTATIVSIAFASAYGWAVWTAGTGIATRRVQWHMPELLEAVSPRQAG